MKKKQTLAIFTGILLGMLTPLAAQAQSHTPLSVPGKEYSDLPDKDQNGAADPEQVLLWDGLGNVTDGFDYGGPGQVDGIANNRDAHFQEVVVNIADLLFSTTGDGPAPILFETPGGASGVWATQPQIDSNGVNDLDGLEVWGPEGKSDSDRYSLDGEPGGISIFAFDGVGTSSPFVTRSQIATAIGRPDLFDVVDVDGLMTFDRQILFSIRPIDVFDGGEIWYWNGAGGLGAAQFLNHGGHLWDTAFDVIGTFGTSSENIDAIEAVGASCIPPDPCQPVPETAPTLGLLALGALGAASTLKRKLK